MLTQVLCVDLNALIENGFQVLVFVWAKTETSCNDLYFTLRVFCVIFF